jgi:dienelactone hydrolase
MAIKAIRAAMLAIGVCTLGGAGIGPALSQSPLNFPSRPLIYPHKSGAKETVLYRPSDGAGPFPAVVLMHTCGGIGPHIYRWAERLTKTDHVVLIVDSLGPRNVSSNCQGADAVISVDAVAADAAAALAHLRTLRFVAGDRLAVMGFSFGAMAALRLSGAAYQRRLTPPLDGLRAVIFFYGTCGTRSPNPKVQATTNNLADDIVTPTLMFLGALDTESPPHFCTSKADRLKSLGQPIQYKLYPDTTHAFDESRWGTEGRTMHHGKRGPFLYRYNPEATEDAWRETRTFFDRHLRGRN